MNVSSIAAAFRPAVIAGERVNFHCHYAWRYLRIDLQMQRSALMPPECHCGSLT